MTSEPHRNSGSGTDGTPPVSSIPLTDDRNGNGSVGGQSIGDLVKDASSHVSTLVRAEIELARAEITSEVKKGLKGSVFFIAALTVLMFSLFYLFFALAELLYDIGLYRSAAFGIVFLLMLLTAGLLAFLGWRKVRKIRAPQRTISSMKETAAALKPRGSAEHSELPDQAEVNRLTGGPTSR
ncbi:phage holin family protein [Tamaricihabitans halophyticus]|uniref:phage holin family protein n=1 Tax=Tamaricihabitans halophyticus TaxID=1262583 RepID=UPI0010478784